MKQGGKRVGKRAPPSKRVAGKGVGKSVKGRAGKSVYMPSRRFSIMESSSSDEQDSDEPEERAVPRKTVRKSPNKSARKSMPKKTVPVAESESEESESVRSDPSSSSDDSDDSDIDFVALSAERKANAIRQARAMKGLSKMQQLAKDAENALESESEEEESEEASGKTVQSVGQPKVGRRKSEAALPDINFAFEENSEDSDKEDKKTDSGLVDFEDIGEEVHISPVSEGFGFDFDSSLVPVPRLGSHEVNSDDDYEIDDNELLAALQADSAQDDFEEHRPHRPSIGSAGDEDEFLREEERFLVREFEHNGFDDDAFDNTGTQGYESSDEDDDYDDLIDFGGPIIDTETKVRAPSDDDDDSYLWNYFFSSDNESESETPQVEQVEDERIRDVPSDDDEGYDSGESTDVDLSLPAPTEKNRFGSKQAKEVLSSKTADYGPPVLGTWMAIESKPFGIIDGLSTRSLQPGAGAEPRGKKSVAHPDEALGLDELLNVSELDDDENDARIWRDFNSQQKKVPLGAFRNKSQLQAMPYYRKNEYKDYDAQAYARSKKKRNDPFPSKSKRRRASIAEAMAEGYRPTKSGLFSENALTNVEEFLGDDSDLMALIRGL